MSKTWKCGTIKGVDVLMNRKGKLNRTDDEVKMGCGVHTPTKYKKKDKQKTKNKLRELVW